MKTVFIIGAGPAGLTAGLELLRRSKDYQVTILEESDMIGGISRTVEHHGNRMDIGGHRFFSKDPRIIDWWEERMPMQQCPAYDDRKLGRNLGWSDSGNIDPEKTDRVMLKRNRVSRIYYKKKFFDYPVRINWNTIKNMGILTTLEAGFSYLYAVIAKKPETSLENFYINRFGRKLYSMFFEGYTEKLWGRHPKDISADWGAQRVKGLSIVAIIQDIFGKLFLKKERKIETSLIEEFSYPKYGPGQLWETTAAEFEQLGGIIKKGCQVKTLQRKNHAIVSLTYQSADGIHTENADIVISSMPLKDLIAGCNEVPEAIQHIAKGLPYRDFVTVGLLLKKLNLKNETTIKTLNNIVPDCWIYVQDVDVKLGRIQIFNNWSCYMVKKPEDTVWIGLEYFCTEGDSYWNLSEDQWAKLGIKELIKMGVIDQNEPILDYHCEKVKKAYPAYFDTYNQIEQLIAYLNDIDNLYCIGRNGQHRYNNMDHSMLTAFAAVSNILEGRTNKNNIWSINTEQEYHEEKVN
ncbi:MAG: NAD(P)/FAD-dependent oxidoreductase [Lachnospiraceae bacterium]